jgi:hypothetical protein
MSSAGLGGISIFGNQFDLTGVSNDPLNSAAKELNSESKISSTDTDDLLATSIGEDTHSSNESNSTADTKLQDPTGANFMADYTARLAFDSSSGGNLSAALDQGVARVMAQYKSSDPSEVTSTISALA